jgi:hypothetical protein
MQLVEDVGASQIKPIRAESNQEFREQLLGLIGKAESIWPKSLFAHRH